MVFNLRGGGKEIILPPNAEAAPKARRNRPLALAMARAYKWQRMLDSGEAASLDELAARYDVDRSHVGRIVKLTTLAPDIIEAVLAGQKPGGLSLASLKCELPLRWDAQRTALLSRDV